MKICDYTTVSALREYSDIKSTSDDAFILKMIKDVSAQIETLSRREFHPRVRTLTFDVPDDETELVVDADLLEVTTLTNGDGTVIPSAYYRLYPLNRYPKHSIRLVGGMYSWYPSVTSYSDAAISVAGIWGYSRIWPETVEDTLASLAAGINASDTSATCTAGKVKAGELLKIDDEWMYASAVVSGTPDQLTLIRGVNGSMAASHLSGARIYRWNPGADIEGLAKRGALALYKLQSNPTAETITVDGVTFSTPKDVTVYLRKTLTELGLMARGMV
jgi:hypothetical protein